MIWGMLCNNLVLLELNPFLSQLGLHTWNCQDVTNSWGLYIHYPELNQEVMLARIFFFDIHIRLCAIVIRKSDVEINCYSLVFVRFQLTQPHTGKEVGVRCLISEIARTTK